MNREHTRILSGEYETDRYVIEAEEDGATAVVVGGIHGNETTSYEAAELVKLWTISSGKIVVIPRAKKPAIDEQSRGAPGQGDPNRKFPSGEEPTSEWASELWDEITSHDPDYVFDLHRSQGLSGGRSPSGVGQTLFPTPDGRDVAEHALDHMNEDHVPSDLLDTHYFRVGNDQNGENPLLSHKVGGDLEPDTLGWLVETTTHRQDSYTQRDQLEHAVETLLFHATDGDLSVDSYGHSEQEPDEDVLEEYNDGNDGDDYDSVERRTAKNIVESIKDEYDL